MLFLLISYFPIFVFFIFQSPPIKPPDPTPVIQLQPEVQLGHSVGQLQLVVQSEQSDEQLQFMIQAGHPSEQLQFTLHF